MGRDYDSLYLMIAAAIEAKSCVISDEFFL
jgi:hypothetical protein